MHATNYAPGTSFILVHALSKICEVLHLTLGLKIGNNQVVYTIVRVALIWGEYSSTFFISNEPRGRFVGYRMGAVL